MRTVPTKLKTEFSPIPGLELVESLFSGSCQAPFGAELLERRAGWARKVDVHRQSPYGFGGGLGIPSSEWLGAPTYYERQWFPCGKCPSCINYRKSRYERAALGWFSGTSLTVLGTLTFNDAWFHARCVSDHEKSISLIDTLWSDYSDAERAALASALRAEVPPKRYNPKVDRHFRDARAWLAEERSAMVKRLREALSRRPEFKGAVLQARMEVMELGTRGERLHCHMLWHFDDVPKGFVTALKKWLRNDWQSKKGVGFVQLRKVKDDEEAVYQLSYLGKFEEAGGRKLYVGSGNPVPQSNGFLSKGYSRYLATRPLRGGEGDRAGNHATPSPADCWPSGRPIGGAV